MNLTKEFLKVANNHANQIAFSFKEQEITYDQFANQITGTISFLKNDINQGDIICCYSENRPEMLTLYLATVAVGGIFVPLNPQLSSKEVAEVMLRTKPTILYTSKTLEGTFKEALNLAELKKEFLFINDVNDYYIRQSTNKGLPLNLEEFSPETEALIVFTSGSTGQPKGVVASHKNELASSAQYKDVWNINEQDKILMNLPLSFVYGLTTACLTCLFAGAHIVLEEKFHPVKALNIIVKENVTLFMGVPTMYNMMLNAAENMTIGNLTSIRLMLTAGAPISDKTVERFKDRFGIQIMNFYALSEVRPVIAFNFKSDQYKHGSCGKVANGVQVKILNEDGQEITTPDTEGELVIKSDTTMKCYYNDPELTASILKDGWFYTGDLAKFDSEGFYYIVGRKKDLIIRGGVNISPTEIEECLSRHPLVSEVAVVGLPDEVFGEKVVASIAFKVEQSTALVKEIKEFARKFLAEYKVPEQIMVLSELPKGNTGKIDKKEVKELWKKSESLQFS